MTGDFKGLHDPQEMIKHIYMHVLQGPEIIIAETEQFDSFENKSYMECLPSNLQDKQGSLQVLDKAYVFRGWGLGW